MLISPPLASLDQHLAKHSDLAEEHLREVKHARAEQEQWYHSDQHRRCHRTFKTSNYEQFKDVNPDRVDNTCQWVLSHPQYMEWHTTPHDGLLWISADPGCGKSVLAKSLVDHELRSTEQHTVCYFFFKDNNEQDDVARALCALLHQLFTYQPQLISYATPAWEKAGEKLAKEIPELWRILIAAARDTEAHDVTCVLDALDECRQSDRRWLIEMMSRFSSQRSAASSSPRRGRLRMLVTSRPYDDIQANFEKTVGNLPVIRLRGEEENDQIHSEINMVIRIRVAQLAKALRLDDHTKSQLEIKLLAMEHRTYLWLHLAIEDIKVTYQRSFRPAEALIKSLPSSVEDAYQKILDRVAREQRSQVKTILQIVVGARRALSVQEMAIALEIATSSEVILLAQAQLEPTWLKNSIRYWCGLFVVISHGRIYLIHQTAREFLLCGNSSLLSLSGWKNCLSPRGTEEELARICVKFLTLEDTWSTARSPVRNIEEYRRTDDLLHEDDHTGSFLVYSAESWSSHVRDGDIPKGGYATAELTTLYATDRALYRKLYDINEVDSDGRTALMWASQFGYDRVVQILLDHGADVNFKGGFYGNALQAAACNGHEKVVQVLLDHGSGVNAQGGYYGNALQAASWTGYEKVVQVLLERGANANVQGGLYGNALQIASERGHENVVKGVVQLLLDRGAKINGLGGYYGNTLQAASAGGHEEVVQLYLDLGAEINAPGGRYGNALQAASAGGHEKVVQLLLDHGAEINAPGHYGNALQVASAVGHEKVVQVLLERGANVNA
ncbi:hypothetical protein LTR41_011586 [Exophiala xenobiotica]|nr:hypothetical protein LTR41_011586 [Exophiala xenobiotica]KAK5550726.1 hypothetical protein LTR46_011264 [Exophiala xenobiotica]